MTAEHAPPPRRWRGPLDSPLGRRLLAAFVLVAFSSVAVLTAAALIGSARGLESAQRAERAQVASRVAEAAAASYAASGSWPAADLAAASGVADAAGAQLVVRDAAGTMVWPGRGRGMGLHATTGTVVEEPVAVAGQRVGTVRLAFPAGDGGRAVAWWWVASAALVALVAALAVAGYVSRALTRPLVSLAATARRFAAGDRAARAGGRDAPGEVGEVVRAFDAMADEVVRAEGVRRRLAADVAHELRTPLAALQAGLEELRDGLRDPDPPRLAALHDQTLRLGRVVQDLADLSAAEAAALSLRPVDTDLAEVARAALTAQRPQLEAAGLQLTAQLAVPLPVRGDPDRLHQAVANVLTNAARYCRPGDRVTVSAHRDPAGWAVLAVADTGPGIPAGDLPHVFERLWRGDASRAVTGSGIGLAVVRELVEAHRGAVTAESPPGGGTTITVRLPAPAPAGAG